MKITPQHEQFGLPRKEAAPLPPENEIADMLQGYRLHAGTMRRDEEMDEA